MQLMLVSILMLCLLVICLVTKLWIIRRNTTNSPFVKYNGIVYHKTDIGDGMSIIIAGQNAYMQVLPSNTKWEYATAKEFKESENKIKRNASR